MTKTDHLKTISWINMILILLDQVPIIPLIPIRPVRLVNRNPASVLSQFTKRLKEVDRIQFFHNFINCMQYHRGRI